LATATGFGALLTIFLATIKNYLIYKLPVLGAAFLA